MVEIKNKKGEVIYTYDGKSLVGAYLYGANLRWADLSNVDLSNADLFEADLTGANFRGADLSDADLRGAVLIRADFRGADLHDANLSDACLKYADLTDANLEGVNLRGADLYWVNFSCANLSGAGLSGANLSGADLTDTIIDETTKGLNYQCPKEGSFIGYKKCIDNIYRKYIVELEIPADARRSSSTEIKCRCDKAKVLSITNLNGTKTDVTEVHSWYNSNFKYKVGKIVEEPNFDDRYWNECTEGIHFFMNRADAVNYYF